jgi:hypothetical protein
MSSGGSKDSTVTNKTDIPSWLQDAAVSNLSFANDVASKPYEQYTGQQVASITPDQQAAYDWVRQNLGTGSNAIGQAAQQITGSNLTTTAQSLLNPYLGAVEQPALDALAKQGARNQNDLASKAAGAGAFGGTRFGVESGVLRRPRRRPRRASCRPTSAARGGTRRSAPRSRRPASRRRSRRSGRPPGSRPPRRCRPRATSSSRTSRRSSRARLRIGRTSRIGGSSSSPSARARSRRPLRRHDHQHAADQQRQRGGVGARRRAVGGRGRVDDPAGLGHRGRRADRRRRRILGEPLI